MNEMREFTVRFDEGVMKRANAAYFGLVLGRYTVGLGLSALFIVTIIFLKVGISDVLPVVFLIFLYAMMSVIAGAFLLRRAQALRLLKKMGDGVVCYGLTEEGVMARSSLGETRLKWVMIEKVWKGKEFWFLFYDKYGHVTLPIEQVPEKDQLFIQECVRAAGGKVVEDVMKRGVRAVYFYCALANFFLFFVIAFLIGGDAVNGHNVEGRYFLASHGKQTEVSQWVWVYSYIHTVGTMLLMGVAILIRVFSGSKKPECVE